VLREEGVATGNRENNSEEVREEAHIPVKMRKQWIEPSAEERVRHSKLHCPFRAWCEFCVMGKCHNDSHTKRTATPDANPVVSIDYAYMKSSEIEKEAGFPILVSRCSHSKWISANVLPKKGAYPEGIRRLGEELDKLGRRRMVVKSDQEPAILKLIEATVRERHQDITTEQSPVGEHASNGVAERAAQAIQGQARTFKLALEARTGKSICETSDILPWLIRHAAMTLNIGQRGEDGRSAWERVKGRAYNHDIPDFGEQVMYLLPESVGVSKLDSRWSTGHFLGIRDESNELLIGTSQGVLKVRIIRYYNTISENGIQ